MRQADGAPYHGERLSDLRAAGAAGDADAYYKLGEAYLYGLGGASRNVGLAVQQFEAGSGSDPDLEKAGQGHAHVVYNIGMAYLDGRGVARDSYRAVRWLTIAANHGVGEAQYNLGLLYYRGDGIQQDLYEALQWMRRGAQGGFLPAQRAVGRIYMTGLDTMGQDLGEARTWLTIAAGRGDSDSKRWLAEMDRAAREEQARRLQLQAAETATYLAAAIFAAALAPPPVTYVVVY
jgi:TPR repeat protein